VFGGIWLNSRDRYLDRLRVGAACRAGVVTLSSRLAIDVISNPCCCCYCFFYRVYSLGSYVGRFSCLAQRGGHLSSIRVMSSWFPLETLPLRGSLNMCIFSLRSAYHFRDRFWGGDGKCSISLCGGPEVPSTGALACLRTTLVMEC